jgi:hypothetical protein
LRDRFLRTLLYEAANVLMTRVKRWSPLKVRIASTVQTAKGVEYIAASATDIHHEAIIDLGKNREPGWLRKARRA